MPMNGRIALLAARSSNSSVPETFHDWDVISPAFYPTSSGPAEFFPLPRVAAGGGTGGAVEPTHVISGIAAPPPYRGGTAWYALGRFNVSDPANPPLGNATPPAPLDASDVLIFAQLHQEPELGGRMLFVGWFNVGAGCLTAPREVEYEPRTNRLVSRPVAELRALRGAVLGRRGRNVLAPSETLPLFDPGSGSLTFDLVLNVTLPAAGPVALTVAVGAASAVDAALSALVNVGAPCARSGLRNVTVTGLSFPGFAAPLRFPLFAPAAGAELPIRVLADRTIAELFVAGAAVSGPMADTSNRTAAYVAADASTGVTVGSSIAWDMGCGWATYP